MYHLCLALPINEMKWTTVYHFHYFHALKQHGTYSISVWKETEGKKKDCPAIHFFEVPKISTQPYLKADFLCLKPHITSKAIFVMEIILILMPKKLMFLILVPNACSRPTLKKIRQVYVIVRPGDSHFLISVEWRAPRVSGLGNQWRDRSDHISASFWRTVFH